MSLEPLAPPDRARRPREQDFEVQQHIPPILPFVIKKFSELLGGFRDIIIYDVLRSFPANPGVLSARTFSELSK